MTAFERLLQTMLETQEMVYQLADRIGVTRAELDEASGVNRP